MPWLLLAHAEQRLSSSMAGLLIASVPLIGAVLYRAAGSHDPSTGVVSSASPWASPGSRPWWAWT